MFNFDVPRYEKVVNGAISLRKDIEQVVDGICQKGFKNLYLIGIGGTYAHFLPIKYMMETISTLEVHVEIAAEFVLKNPRFFGPDSLCLFTSRTGKTREVVAAAKYCRDKGATTVGFVSHDNTPLTEIVDFKFINFAEDDNLAESIYLQIIPAVFRIMYNRGEFPQYGKMMDQMNNLTPYLIKAKEQHEKFTKDFAEHNKDVDYYMVVGSGNVWGEAYDYAMCILEEMQWIKTKSIHAAEFFHGTLELVEKDTRIILLYGEDETRPLMDRVKNFAVRFSDEVSIFDTASVTLPFDADLRKYFAPVVIYAVTERLSCHLERVRNHPLTTRRYYNQIPY